MLGVTAVFWTFKKKTKKTHILLVSVHHDQKGYIPQAHVHSGAVQSWICNLIL